MHRLDRPLIRWHAELLGVVATVVIALLVLLMLQSCAAKSKPYVTAGKITLAVSAVLQNASDTADTAYANQLMTGAQLNRFRDIVLPIAESTRAAETVLIGWPLDADAPPPDLFKLLDALDRGIQQLSEAFPDSTTKTALLGYLRSAKAVAETVLSLFPAKE